MDVIVIMIDSYISFMRQEVIVLGIFGFINFLVYELYWEIECEI